MSDKMEFDELEEMHIPGLRKKEEASRVLQSEEAEASFDWDNDVYIPANRRPTEPEVPVVKGKGKVKKGEMAAQAAKKARLEEKKRKKRNETITIVSVCSVLFLLILFLIFGVSTGWQFFSNHSANDGSYTDQVEMAPRDMSKGEFLNKSNIPELSAEGVKGELSQAYYTSDGGLAVVLNLSNGTPNELEVTRINARVFNDKDETVAQQTVDNLNPKCRVPANGYGEVYFVIDRSNVVLRNDPLSALGVMLEITSTPTSGNVASVGKGPKDIAEGRSYYENVQNRPELSAEGVKATVIRARYTNDGSLAIGFSLSNGTAQKQNVSRIDLQLANGSGATIVSYSFDRFETPCHVEAGGYNEVELIVDGSYVNIPDDSLYSLSTTISVSANPV